MSSTTPATPEALQTALDHSIWYLLSLWPALTTAIGSSWGGPDSVDKKDWFAGAVSELLTSRPDTDAEDLECFLLQIMQDEYDCYVEDESECQVARDILAVKARMMEERTTDAARDVEERWKNRGALKGETRAVVAREVNQDVGDDEDVGELVGGDDDDDDEMDEAPRLVPAVVKEKVEPEVDEDGFTKVVGKKKR